MKLIGYFCGELAIVGSFCVPSAKYRHPEAESDLILMLFMKLPDYRLDSCVIRISDLCDVNLSKLTQMQGKNISITEEIDEGCTLINCEDGNHIRFINNSQLAAANG